MRREIDTIDTDDEVSSGSSSSSAEPIVVPKETKEKSKGKSKGEFDWSELGSARNVQAPWDFQKVQGNDET